MDKVTYIDVAPAVVLPAQARQVYTYHLPPKTSIERYTIVHIPFRHRVVPGVVMAVHTKKVSYPTKSCQTVTPIRLTEKQVILASWVASVAHGGLGYTLRLFFPPSGSAAPLEPLSLPSTQGRMTELGKQLMTQDAAILGSVSEVQKKIRGVSRSLMYQHQQILVVVPEKHLIDRWYQYYTAQGYPVAIIHGQIPKKTLRAWWLHLAQGKPGVIIGTQKSLWLPFTKLSLIILDQEHYPTHKQWDQYPRMHTWYPVQVLKTVHACPLLYTTNLPSLRLWHHLQTGKVALFGTLPANAPLTTIPFSFEDRLERHSLPDELITRIQHWYTQKKRILLLYNKKGAFRAVVCRSCQTRLTCDRCGVTLMMHKSNTESSLSCPHCTLSTPLPAVCPHCHRKKLVPVGFGNEKVEYILKKIVGTTDTVLRIDTDTPLDKTIRKKILTKKQLIVVATSAIFSQGADHSFDHVLWLFPEKSLLYPDFRSVERSVYLLYRLSTLLRSKATPLFLVTAMENSLRPLYRPLNQLYTILLQERKRFAYPPFSDIVILTTQAKTEAQALKRAQTIKTMIRKQHADITMRGPFQAFRTKENGLFTWHLMLMGALETLQAVYQEMPVDRVDVDPQRIV